jgi:hypothetical protein
MPEAKNLHQKFQDKKSSKGNFTFIESLIALTLIAFVIFFFFFASNLAKQNNVKSLISQIGQYNSAITTFTEKYHALPGDMDNSVTYGITKLNTDGNNDNSITDLSGEILQANGEITNFWHHLSQAKMLNKNFDGKENENATIGKSFPINPLGEKNGIVVFSFEGKIFYQVGLKSLDQKKMHMGNFLKTSEAFLLDQKIDDGNPTKGNVVAAGSNILNFLENKECVKFNEYDQSNIKPACQIRIEIR